MGGETTVDMSAGGVAYSMDHPPAHAAVLRGVRRTVSRGLGRPSAAPLLTMLSPRRRKTFSAIVKVKNEQEFLERSVRSIVDHVEEVLLIDNLSTDSTPQIIKVLAQEYPNKVRALSYPHVIARNGSENVALWQSRGGRHSPSLLANYYDWCLHQCSEPYALKWDGDTVATDLMAGALDQFRSTSAQALWHIGANLHDSRTHLIRGRPYEDSEPRLFRRQFARYDNSGWECEALQTPYIRHEDRYSDRCSEPLYVHLKYCKVDRFANISADMKAIVSDYDQPGEEITPVVRRTVERWKL